MSEENGWDEYKRLVLYRLDNMDGDVRAVHAEIRQLRREVLGLKRASAKWGGLAGLLTGIATALAALAK